ncbi:MAG: putative collagen-binding domain-containing protein [Candidatus Omnitrophota bacterium]
MKLSIKAWKNFRRVFIFLPMMALVYPALAGTPIQLHPENPHYFLFRGEPTILITSGEHYGAVLNLDFDAIPYLDELKANGLNLTRTFSGAYCERFGEFNIEKNTLGPAPLRFVCPWARSAEPGYKNGGNKFNLTKWDEAYFQRLKRFVAEAGKRGIVVELVLFCPFYNPELWTFSPMNAINNINGFSKVSSMEPYAMKDADLLAVQDAMVRKIVEELKIFENLYYEICNEPYFGGVTKEFQRHIAATIVEVESAFPGKHLIAQNIANGSGVIDDPDPNVSLFNYHYAYPPDAVGQNYRLNKAIGYDETGFSGDSDVKYRGDAWAFLLAGGGLFDNLDYSFTTEYENGIASQNAPGGGSPALRLQLKILKDFMYSFDFIRMKPDSSIIAGLEPSKPIRAWALAEEGEACAVYLRGGQQADIRLKMAPGAYKAEWVNTVTGKVDKAETIKHAEGEMKLSSPEYSSDIALRVLRTKK